MPNPGHLTERQEKWFASVQAGLERDTGRTVEQWAEIARQCPETAHRKRLAWMKAEHNLGQNHASMVLNAAFPPEASWSRPDALAEGLWADAEQRRLFEAARSMVTALPDVVVGQRRSFTAFSRRVQFAAVRPIKAGGILLGLALDPDDRSGLTAPRRESWSERLKATLQISQATQIDSDLETLLRSAWERS